MKQQMSITFRAGPHTGLATFTAAITCDDSPPSWTIENFMEAAKQLLVSMFVHAGGEVLHTTGPTEIPEEVPS